MRNCAADTREENRETFKSLFKTENTDKLNKQKDNSKRREWSDFVTLLPLWGLILRRIISKTNFSQLKTLELDTLNPDRLI